MQFCCEALEYAVSREEINYDEIRGSFWFYFKRYGKSRSYGLHCASYCPYCGAKLHEDLVDELEEILENEYGIMLCNVDLNDPNTLPEEFRSDEWWKKRGL